jgi:hypothetical protein
MVSGGMDCEDEGRGRIIIREPMSGENAAGPNASKSNESLKKSVLFVFITIVPPGLHVAVVSDSMVVSAGRVGEGLGTIGARIRLLASVNILVCFEMELGREALTALRTDNRAERRGN